MAACCESLVDNQCGAAGVNPHLLKAGGKVRETAPPEFKCTSCISLFVE